MYVCVDVSRVYMCRAYTYICQFGARVAKQHVYMQVEANSWCIGIVCEIYMDESKAACTRMCVYMCVRTMYHRCAPECQIIDWLGQIRRRAHSLCLSLATYANTRIYTYAYVYISVLLLVSLSLLSSRSDKQWDIKWDVEK